MVLPWCIRKYECISFSWRLKSSVYPAKEIVINEKTVRQQQSVYANNRHAKLTLFEAKALIYRYCFELKMIKYFILEVLIIIFEALFFLCF